MGRGQHPGSTTTSRTPIYCTDDSELTVLADGTEEYRDDAGQRHRAGGLPAVIRPNGTREWWWHDALHRTDGPARVVVNYYGCVSVEWFWQGRPVSECEWAQELRQHILKTQPEPEPFLFRGDPDPHHRQRRRWRSIFDPSITAQPVRSLSIGLTFNDEY
jgi:hypothetical protein